MEKVINGLNVTVKEEGELDTEAVARFLEDRVREKPKTT